MILRFVPTRLCPLLLVLLGATWLWAQDDGPAISPERAALGKRLFEELNFTNQAADYGASCSGCHSGEGDVRGRATRAFADYTPQSLTATKKTTLRNSPTLVDVGRAPLLGWDGAAGDLEALVLEKLTGSLMGWAPKDRERAVQAIHFTLLHEGSGGTKGASYLARFSTAYGVDLEALTVEDAVKQGARAIADYVRSLESSHTSPWDAFVEMNRFHPAPNEGEDPKHFAYGIWSRIGNQEGRRLIKRPQGFSADAYQGFRTFFRVDDIEGGAVGNCVTCHVPPNFTDNLFHNVGISELEYDAVHGPGSAAKLTAPSPQQATAQSPDSANADAIDLGRAHVDGQQSSLGAFKTPTLRHNRGTDPYMHNGKYETLTVAIGAHAEAAELARAGKLPWADSELELIAIGEKDIEQLAAFVEQLNEVAPVEFRSLLIKLADDQLTYDW